MRVGLGVVECDVESEVEPNFYRGRNGSGVGWIDELWFYVPSTVFQSFRDDGRVNMKGSVQ